MQSYWSQLRPALSNSYSPSVVRSTGRSNSGSVNRRNNARRNNNNRHSTTNNSINSRRTPPTMPRPTDAPWAPRRRYNTRTNRTPRTNRTNRTPRTNRSNGSNRTPPPMPRPTAPPPAPRKPTRVTRTLRFTPNNNHNQIIAAYLAGRIPRLPPFPLNRARGRMVGTTWVVPPRNRASAE